ncbi:hypothetical protein Q7P35_008599 [Cladosporium inversicolor]
MHSLKSCVLLAAVAHGATIQERAIVPFRAPKIPERPDFIPSGSGGLRTHIGSGTSDAAGAWAGIAAGGRGTAPESTAPFQPGFYERNKELIEKAVEVVGQVFDVLQNVIDLSGGSDDEDDTEKWQPTNTLPPSLRPTQVASTSDGASNSTTNYIISQNNITYTFFSDPRLMSKDVVAQMADPPFNRLSSYQDLFTSREYSMFLNDPICFYANIESMYLNSSATVQAGASMTPSPTQSLQRRQTTDGESTTCVGPMIPGVSQVCSAVAGSPQWSSSQASEISSLWASQLPDQLWSAHFATPTAVSGEVTATATSTTSCVGLDGGEGPVTRYRELQIRGMDAEETSGTGDGGESTAITPANESVSVGVKIGGVSLLACTMGGAAAVIATLVL